MLNILYHFRKKRLEKKMMKLHQASISSRIVSAQHARQYLEYYKKFKKLLCTSNDATMASAELIVYADKYQTIVDRLRSQLLQGNETVFMKYDN